MHCLLLLVAANKGQGTCLLVPSYATFHEILSSEHHHARAPPPPTLAFRHGLLLPSSAMNVPSLQSTFDDCLGAIGRPQFYCGHSESCLVAVVRAFLSLSLSARISTNCCQPVVVDCRGISEVIGSSPASLCFDKPPQFRLFLS